MDRGEAVDNTEEQNNANSFEFDLTQVRFSSK
jgi:hypothetical protein